MRIGHFLGYLPPDVCTTGCIQRNIHERAFLRRAQRRKTSWDTQIWEPGDIPSNSHMINAPNKEWGSYSIYSHIYIYIYIYILIILSAITTYKYTFAMLIQLLLIQYIIYINILLYTMFIFK